LFECDNIAKFSQCHIKYLAMSIWQDNKGLINSIKRLNQIINNY